MKYPCTQSAVLLAFLVFVPITWAQTQPVLTIDPAGEHSRVYLSSMDEATRAVVARKFDFNAPFYRDAKPLSLLLTNASGKSIIALTIGWTAISPDRYPFPQYSGTDSLRGLNGAGAGMRSWSLATGGEVARSGERMLVAPGIFIRESLGTGGGSNAASSFIKVERVTAILDAVVLEDGEVLGPDASGTVDSFRKRKAAIDELLKAIKEGEQSGRDGIEILKSIDPMRGGVKLSFRDIEIAQMLSSLVTGLMSSSDWRQRLEKMSTIQLPNFHRQPER
jgi:hypothetical protein